MVRQGRSIGSLFVLVAVSILLLSTGGTSGMFVEREAVGGHAAYVTAVVAAGGTRIQDPEPISYGLATLQDTHLFGLIVRPRVLDETSDRMVFVWAADALDPREDADLAPTGEWARVRDRGGLHWTVHEFQYGFAAPAGPFYAYGVEVGSPRVLPDGTEYNHVLTYRPDRLAAPFLPAMKGGHLSLPLERGTGPVPESLSHRPPPGVTWATLTALD